MPLRVSSRRYPPHNDPEMLRDLALPRKAATLEHRNGSIVAKAARRFVSSTSFLRIGAPRTDSGMGSRRPRRPAATVAGRRR
jgi:hypothetical protein